MKKILITAIFLIGTLTVFAQSARRHDYNPETRGVFNVLDYGADPTGVANSTTAIQAAIDAAKNAIVLIPQGKYLVDSLCILYSPMIQGSGFATSGTSDYGTELISTTALPVINVYNMTGTIWSFGVTIRDLSIKGNNAPKADGMFQDGIKISTQAWMAVIERVRINYCGGHGIRFDTLTHVTGITIRDCALYYNSRGGIYGRKTSGAEVNAINILNSAISANYSHGIDVVGTNIKIRDNIIQGNDSCGVFISARNMGDVSCSSSNTLIDGNYFEVNNGGEIVIEGYGDGTISKYNADVSITNNFFSTDGNQIDRPDVNASITLANLPDNVAGYSIIKDLYISNTNNFGVTNGAYWFDGGASSQLQGDCVIELPLANDALTKIINTGYATINIEGTSYAATIIPRVTVTGITASRLHPFIKLSQDSGPIDITTNPQIVDGFEGQVITIAGNDDTNTLTLDDGDNLQLAGGASCVLGSGDTITLIFSYGIWRELTRSDN